MSLKEQTYSVLVVSSSKSFDSVLASLLPDSGFSPVITAAGRHYHGYSVYCGAHHDCGFCDGSCLQAP